MLCARSLYPRVEREREREGFLEFSCYRSRFVSRVPPERGNAVASERGQGGTNQSNYDVRQDRFTERSNNPTLRDFNSVLLCARSFSPNSFVVDGNRRDLNRQVRRTTRERERKKFSPRVATLYSRAENAGRAVPVFVTVRHARLLEYASASAIGR